VRQSFFLFIKFVIFHNNLYEEYKRKGAFFMKNIKKRWLRFLTIFFIMTMMTVIHSSTFNSYAERINVEEDLKYNSGTLNTGNSGSGSGSESTADKDSLEGNIKTETEEIKLPVDKKSVDDAKKSLQDILTGSNGLVKIVQAMGYLIILFGLFKFALSLKDENAEGKSQAIMILMGGVFAVVLPSIIDAIFSGTAISGLLTK
jgi:hypothetical protein